MLIDAVFAVLMVFAVIKGYRNGLIIAAFSFLGIIIGLAAAMKLSALVAGRLKESTQITAAWLPFISFAIVILGVMLLVRLGAKLAEAALRLALLGWLNKIGGIVLFAALYTVVLSVFIFFADKLHLLRPETLAASKTYPFIQPCGPKLLDGIGTVMPIFKGLFEQLTQFFEGIGKAAK